MKKLIILGLVVVMAGCANTDSRIVDKTAYQLGVESNDVRLIKAEKGMLDTIWTAEVKGEKYQCSADDMLRGISCKKL